MTLIFMILIILAAYLLGSVSFGLLISKAMNLGDLRKIGSGNIGATNVLRTGNKGAAAATLILDGAKGAVAVLIARALFGDLAGMLAGLAAFLGHLYPVWLGFKGGKGVATFLGILLALSFPAGLCACATWLATAFGLKYSSLSALIAAASGPLWLLIFGPPGSVWLGLVLAILIFWRHRSNIERLLKGEEPRIGSK